MVHVPAERIVTVVLATEQTPDVAELKATVREDVEVAETVKAASPYVLLANVLKVIVCVAAAMVNSNVSVAFPDVFVAVTV